MSAMDGKVIRADMFVNDVRIGRSQAGLDSSDTTTTLDLETTTTLDQQYELKAGDEVCKICQVILYLTFICRFML